MPDSAAPFDFDLKALYAALDEQRHARGLTWAALAREVGRRASTEHPISPATITRLKAGGVAEGDGVLQLLLWLHRTPESFVPDFPEADAEILCLPQVAEGQILRWESRALHAALDAQRQARGLTWVQVAQEVGGYTPDMIANLVTGGRVAFPRVMRLVRWLDLPAAAFTRCVGVEPSAATRARTHRGPPCTAQGTASEPHASACKPSR